MSKKLLLAGSSIMEQWHQPASLAPDWEVVNRAIGGTTTSDWIRIFRKVLDEEKPKAVLMYVGSNDFGNGVPPAQIGAGVGMIRNILRLYAPEVPMAYLAIIKAPVRAEGFAGIQEANELAKGRLRLEPVGHGDPLLPTLPSSEPLDLWIESDPFFLEEGRPVQRYFTEDGLHLTLEAYRGLTAAIQPQLGAWLAAIP